MKLVSLPPKLALLFVIASTSSSMVAQTSSPQGLIPMTAATNDAPYVPQPLYPGGVVVTLFPPDSHFLKPERIRESEKYTMTPGVPGRVQSIVNIHNPSVEFHPADPGVNTGTTIILAAGGAHTSLNVGTESTDFIPFFYNYGVNTVILRNRLRSSGYNPQVDAVNDALQAIRVVRAHAKEWKINPDRIGIMGFSAGAELSAPAAIQFPDFDRTNNVPGDPLAGISSRPDFVGIVYPGPSPFARNPDAPVPTNTPPAFITCAGSGDAQHAVWADQYFAAMMRAQIPNVEMHIYGNGVHANGLKYRNGTPYGTWQDRFIDWFRDLGFLDKPKIDEKTGQLAETKAARDVAAYKPPRTGGGGGRRGGRGGASTNAPNSTAPAPSAVPVSTPQP